MNASDAVGEAIFFLLLLCWLVLLPAWTYRDAKKNSFNPKLCLLLVLFCPDFLLSVLQKPQQATLSAEPSAWMRCLFRKND